MEQSMEQSSKKITGAEILIRCLHEENVEFVFGYPGGAVLHIYDAIFHQDKFKHILVRHEQAALHAADAYSRSTGKVGVALVTSGPGATNAITGKAYSDQYPGDSISGFFFICRSLNCFLALLCMSLIATELFSVALLGV